MNKHEKFYLFIKKSPRQIGGFTFLKWPVAKKFKGAMGLNEGDSFDILIWLSIN